MKKKYTPIASCNFTDRVIILGVKKLNEYECWHLILRLKKTAPFRDVSSFFPLVYRAATRTGYHIEIAGNAIPMRRYQPGEILTATANVRQSYSAGVWQVNNIYWDLSATDCTYYRRLSKRVKFETLRAFFPDSF